MQNASNFSILDRYSKAEFLFEFAPTLVTIDRWITPFWLVIGIFSNLTSAIVWFDKKLRRNNSSAVYLIALSLCDFAFLVLYIFHELTEAWGYAVYTSRVACKVYFFLYYWPQYLSPILVLGFTVERFIAVCYPFQKEKFCTVGRAIYVVVALVLFTMLLSVPHLIMQDFSERMYSCHMKAMKGVKEAWSWFSEMLVFGAVPLAVLIFNMRVLCVIKHLTRTSSLRLPHQPQGGSSTASTLTLLCVSFYLILTTLPVTAVYIVYFYLHTQNYRLTDAEVRRDPGWQYWFSFMTARKLIEEICLSHYCLYFFIYAVTGKLFRKTLKAKIQSCWTCPQYGEKRSGSYRAVGVNGTSGNGAGVNGNTLTSIV